MAENQTVHHQVATTGVLLQLKLAISCIFDYHLQMLMLTAAVIHLGICTDYFIRETSINECASYSAGPIAHGNSGHQNCSLSSLHIVTKPSVIGFLGDVAKSYGESYTT